MLRKFLRWYGDKMFVIAYVVLYLAHLPDPLP